MSATPYYLYILTCADGTLYTGITTDLKKRVDEHNRGVAGAKYTRSRLPVFVSYSTPVGDKSAALREEYKMKQLTREAKLALIKESKKNKPKKNQQKKQSNTPVKKRAVRKAK